jgi:hypothetical protein
MLLLLLLLAEAAAIDCNTSGADSSVGSTSGSRGGTSSSSSSSSSSCGSGSTSSGSGVGGSNGSQQQQQQQQQLSMAVDKLFFIGGWCNSPAWAVSAISLLDDDTFTSVICGPTDSGSSSSSGSSQAAFRKVLASSSSSSSSSGIQVFTVLAQVITGCLCAWVGEPAGPQFWLDSWVAGGMVRLCTPPRCAGLQAVREQLQQQQLLLLVQQMVWQLPVVLLNVVHLYGGEHALVTSAAAEAAWCCCSCWLVLVMQPDDENVGRLSTKRLPQQCSQQLLQVLPLLQDCWLQLMQRQLQGPDGGMLLRAAAPQQQQVRARIRCCSCYPLSRPQPPGGFDSSADATITLDCGAAYSITALLALLEPLSYFGPLSVWEGKLPAVLLLLEVLLRKHSAHVSWQQAGQAVALHAAQHIRCCIHAQNSLL